MAITIPMVPEASNKGNREKKAQQHCFTGLALCSYTECCGLGGWVGLLVALLWQSRCALWRLSWCLEKQNFDLKISLDCFALFWYFRCGIWKLQL